MIPALLAKEKREIEINQLNYKQIRVIKINILKKFIKSVKYLSDITYLYIQIIEMEDYSHLFHIGSDFNPKSDEVMQLLFDCRYQNTQYPSGMKFIRLKEFQKLTKAEIGEWLHDPKNDSWGVLKNLRVKQLKEVQLVANDLELLHTTKWDYTKYAQLGLSPQEILYCENKLKIRLQRAADVVVPEFTQTSSVHKKTGISYDMIKAYWVNDDGLRKRSFTKNIIKSEATKSEMAAKLFQANNIPVIELDSKISNGVRVDLIVEKDNVQWVVETKDIVKNDFIKTYLTFELWKHYNSIYGNR